MQQRVYPRLEDPFDDRVPPGEKVLADLCMFIWDNKHADGIVSRAAQSWLLNVAAGEAKAVPPGPAGARLWPGIPRISGLRPCHGAKTNYTS